MTRAQIPVYGIADRSFDLDPWVETVMTKPLALHDITIHPVVEQQGAFFEVLGFFPALTKELLDENRAWLQPAFVDADDSRSSMRTSSTIQCCLARWRSLDICSCRLSRRVFRRLPV
jgi:hypothetical protein